jgi:hypothetical protein
MAVQSLAPTRSSIGGAGRVAVVALITNLPR